MAHHRKVVFMKASMVSKALLTLLALPLATAVSAKDMPSRPDTDPSKITISCFRGPLRVVAWDRPNAVFIDDLVQLGYSRPEAHAIGERVCRDEYGVYNPEYQLQSLGRILAQTPPR